MSGLTHLDDRGRARMVDVSDKEVTARTDTATGVLTCERETVEQVRAGTTPKGSVITTAELAGVMAAKRTSTLIPLCHPLQLTHIGVELTPTRTGYGIEARVRTNGQTGVEMEALTAVAVAALTIYDMVKAVDRSMVIGDIRLTMKSGGRSGTYTRRDRRPARKPRTQA